MRKNKHCRKCGGVCHGMHSFSEGSQRAGITVSAWSAKSAEKFIGSAISRVIDATVVNRRVKVTLAP